MKIDVQRIKYRCTIRTIGPENLHLKKSFPNPHCYIVKMSVKNYNNTYLLKIKLQYTLKRKWYF